MGWLNTGAIVGLITAALLRLMLRYKRMCPSSAKMNGKTVIITGANSGIGKAAALELAKRKARVILACRSIDAANKTKEQLQSLSGNNSIVAKELDLASLHSVREFCSQILAEEADIHVLINNAGVFQCPYTKTADGFEMQMGVNHFGHFLLTNLLLDRLKRSSPSRIVIVGSQLHKRGAINFDDINSERNYNKAKAYADSKLANLLFARELAERLEGSGVDVFALHPGIVCTNLARHIISSWKISLFCSIGGLFGLRNAEEGCQVIVYCSVAKKLTGQSGKYISKNFVESKWTPVVLNDKAAKKLWSVSERLTMGQ